MEYRRRKNSDIWHWCRNCSNWPVGRAGVDYVAWQTRPPETELDKECRAKEERGACRLERRGRERLHGARRGRA